jgi:hypothetical protein
MFSIFLDTLNNARGLGLNGLRDTVIGCAQSSLYTKSVCRAASGACISIQSSMYINVVVVGF